jgi:transposase InsO family protein
MTKSQDKTIENNYLNRFEHLIKEYELIKQKKHPTYSKVKDFYADNKIAHQNFSKYYNRYIQNNRDLETLKPQKRGPKYKARRISNIVENRIIELRLLGFNRFEIQRIIKEEKLETIPSLTTIYNYAKKHKLNILNKKMKEEKVRIIREKAGDLYHADCHNLGKGIIRGDKNTYYLVSIIDDCTRLAWGEVVEDIKSLTVMFSVLRSINMLRVQYGIEPKEMLTDNGSEFGQKTSRSKEEHPFERMLIELGIKHRYTRPYRPQTNGKIERFWRTLNNDLIEETDFDSKEELRDELLQYMVYYNEARGHQALNGLTPKEFFLNLKTASN